METELEFGERKAVKKWGHYLCIMLPMAYTQAFNIKIGNRYKISAKPNGDLILRLVKEDGRHINH
jgi:antitoxin component of MazEF toxin-antitoxin module